MAETTIAIVDDHPTMIEGITAILRQKSELNVVGTGRSAADVLSLASAHQLDVMIIGLSLTHDTLKEIANLRAAFPRTRVVVFTTSTDTDHAIRALDAGAGAYVLKGSPAADVVKAIEATGRGEVYITPAIAGNVMLQTQSKSLDSGNAVKIHLSLREEQIVRLLLSGKQNREIAQDLSLAIPTIEKCMTLLMKKLRARNRIEVVMAAQRLQLVATSEFNAPPTPPSTS